MVDQPKHESKQPKRAAKPRQNGMTAERNIEAHIGPAHRAGMEESKMSQMDKYVTDPRFLNATMVSQKELCTLNSRERIWKTIYEIHLTNGKKIVVINNAKYDDDNDDSVCGDIWPWKVDGQLFCRDKSALDYLKQIVGEKLTGKRILFGHKHDIPDICQGGCRHPSECNRGMCHQCPIAGEFFAEQDGVELIYAVNKED